MKPSKFDTETNKRITETEVLLGSLGTVEDESMYILENYRKVIPKSYTLLENKYNDVDNDSLCIEIHSNGTYVVTNSELPYTCYNSDDLRFLKELFSKTSFAVEVTERDMGAYIALVSVSAKVNNLEEAGKLIKEYRVQNDLYLADKTTEIIGNDGNIYLDNIKHTYD